MCANNEIRRMPNAIHVIFTNIIHNYVNGIDPLASELKVPEGHNTFAIQRSPLKAG